MKPSTRSRCLRLTAYGFLLLRGVTAAWGVVTASQEANPLAGIFSRAILWLSPESLSSSGGEGGISQWEDISGNDNDAIQSKPENQPKITDGPNGFKAVKITGPGGAMRIPSLHLGYETSVFIVALDTVQPEQKSIHHAVFSADNDPYRKDGDGYGFAYYNGPFDGYTVILSDGKKWEHLRDWAVKTARESFEVVSFVKTGTHASLYRNGYRVAEREFTRPKDASWHTGYQLGWGEGRTYVGAVAEVIVFDGSLDEAQRRQVENYLGKKYDIAIAENPRIASSDPRFFDNGLYLYGSGYSDQPYVLQLDAEHWLCVLTAAAKEENDKDRHLVFLESSDAGKTWKSIDTWIEPPSENRMPSWGTLLQTPSGRVYCFYNLEPEQRGQRLVYAYRYSDDNGRTWSQRLTLPVRVTDIDGNFRNARSWGIDRPLVLDGKVYLAFTKFGGPDRHGEGFLMMSDNILTENDPDKITWVTLPEGGKGIRSDKLGFLQEEFNVESLGDDPNGLYCVFRTLQGYVGESYSHDGGKTWSEPQYAVYTNGSPVKNPRACPMMWRTRSGNYLMWTHNHDGRSTPERNKNRNPAWLSGGVLKDGRIVWSEPEPVLFGKIFKHNSGMSYPDLVEKDGHYYITATNKETARMFEIPCAMLENLWKSAADPASVKAPALDGHFGGAVSLQEESLTLVFAVKSATKPGEILYNGFNAQGKGVRVLANADGSLTVLLADDSSAAPFVWRTDVPASGKTQGCYALIFDGPADLLYVLKDGVLQDGGVSREFGWGRFSHETAQIPLPQPVVSPQCALLGMARERLSIAEAAALTAKITDESIEQKTH